MFIDTKVAKFRPYASSSYWRKFQYNGLQVVVLAVVLTGFPLFSPRLFDFSRVFLQQNYRKCRGLKKFPRKSHRTDNFTLSPVRRRCTQYDEYNGSIVRSSYWKLEASVLSHWCAFRRTFMQTILKCHRTRCTGPKDTINRRKITFASTTNLRKLA